MMPPNGNNQLLSPPNVLRNLPDNLINDILTRLPLRDAVRTSILSKKWRYNWCGLPQIELDQTLWKAKEDLTSAKIGNGIQHLVLKLPMDNQHKLLPNQYKLPSSFFTCSQLKHLFLQQCLIHSPPLFKGFDRLISLELIEVTISSELLGSLISHSPLLDHLVLDCNEVSHHVEISAPKLRSFFFSGNINFLHLKKVPLLSEVSYEPVEFSIDAEHDLAKIFESIPALENLCWNHECLQEEYVGPAEVIPTRLPFALNCLKRLDIYKITLGEFFDLSFALCLIRSSPNLEELEIKMFFIRDECCNEPMPRDAIDEIPASFSDMTFNTRRQ
ncbi:hypothetical protein P3L10_031210 [Capsicum annuum]